MNIISMVSHSWQEILPRRSHGRYLRGRWASLQLLPSLIESTVRMRALSIMILHARGTCRHHGVVQVGAGRCASPGDRRHATPGDASGTWKIAVLPTSRAPPLHLPRPRRPQPCQSHQLSPQTHRSHTAQRWCCRTRERRRLSRAPPPAQDFEA